MINPLKAVIFDVDGTLVDSNMLHAQAWQRAFKAYGTNLPLKKILHQIGKGGDQLIPVFWTPRQVDRYGEHLEQLRADLFERDYLPRVKPFRRVRQLFERINSDGMRIALASSAQEEELAHHIQALRIKKFIEAATSASDVRKSKPCPDIFIAALRKLKPVKAHETIVVGDTPYDARAAKKAGLKTIGVLSGGYSAQSLRTAGACAVYADISELLQRYDESPLASTAPAKAVKKR